MFRDQVDETLSRLNLKPSASELKLMLRTVSWRVESAPPVVAKVYKRGKVDADPIHGRYELMAGGKRSVVEYEPDSELRDSEQFTRHFYQPKPLRTLEEIRADILAVRNEAEGLLDELVQGAAK